MNIHIKKEAIRKGSLYLYSLEVFKKYSDAKLCFPKMGLSNKF